MVIVTTITIIAVATGTTVIVAECGMNGNKQQYTFCEEGCKCLDPSAPPAVKGLINGLESINNAPNSCPGECGAPYWVGDGRCDDNNNNCGRKWDGGDCCGTSGDRFQFSYCNKDAGCKCLDPAKAGVPKACAGRCGSAQFVGDGNCDDDNNNCGCTWDGGDCCGSKGIKLQYSYCKECARKDPDAKCTAKCEHASYKGDGRCDDGNNHCGCDWDGGDCCGPSGDKQQWLYCKQCQDPGGHAGKRGDTCGAADWF